MRVFLINLLTTAILLVVCVGVLEISLRFYYFGSVSPFIGGPKLYKPDPQLGFVLNPNITSSQQRVDFIVPVTTNSMGLRGAEIGVKSDAFRIAVLGDSHIFGSGLADDETLPAQLQVVFNALFGPGRVEVINAGSPAHNTVQELLQHQRLAEKINADLWILGFTPENDIQFNTAALRSFMTNGPRRPVASFTGTGELALDYSGAERYFRKNKWRLEGTLHDRPWYENTAVYLRGKLAWKGFGGPEEFDPNIILGAPYLAAFSPEYKIATTTNIDLQELWQDGWDVTKALILKIRDHSKAQGAAFAMISMPSDVQFKPGIKEGFLKQFPNLKIDDRRADRDLQAFGDAHAIPVLDAYTPLAQARAGGLQNFHYSKFDSHMLPIAHEIMAKSLARQLVDEKLVPVN
ncbi:MAG: SGNH/GDSL hydrolase family protein [Pseudomonadota bacterium]